MSGENRGIVKAADTSPSSKLSAIEVKNIYVQNIEDEDTRPIKIAMNKTVKDLKKEIEKLFNLSYTLDDCQIRYKNNGMNCFKIIFEEKENKTLFENQLTSDSLVIFGKESIL